MPSYIEELLHLPELEGNIYVRTDYGMRNLYLFYAGAQEISQELGVSTATAYRIMAHLPKFNAYDQRNSDIKHVFTVVRRKDLEAYKRTKKGNPNFTDSQYQSDLASRPRK